MLLIVYKVLKSYEDMVKAHNTFYIKGKECPECHKKQVESAGSDWSNGNPTTPAADTEMEFRYKCANPTCQYTWSEFV